MQDIDATASSPLMVALDDAINALQNYISVGACPSPYLDTLARAMTVAMASLPEGLLDDAQWQARVIRDGFQLSRKPDGDIDIWIRTWKEVRKLIQFVGS